jgi:hypothetical protein
MGSRGPIPKRDAERRRQNKPDVPTDTVRMIGRVRVPAADKTWHPIATRLYRSLRKSGQAKFLEPSDWAIAYLLAESLSRDLNEQVVGISEKTGEAVWATIPLKGASLAAYLKAFSALGMTEGDRRRMRIEIERETPVEGDNPDVAVLASYRAKIQGP